MAIQPTSSKAQQPVIYGGVVPLLSGVLAVAMSCGVTLLGGLRDAWDAQRVAWYGVASVAALLWACLPGFLPERWTRWVSRLGFVFLVAGGIVMLLVQAISGEPYLQPIVFTVVFVHATLLYSGKFGPSLGFGVFYLALMVLGLWLSGQRDLSAIGGSVVAYGAIFGFFYAFTGLSTTQARARAHADTLAADLARERDALARLIAINTTLTRDLEQDAVLREVVAAGRALTGAQVARVWLRTASSPEGAQLHLASAQPPGPVAPPAPETRAALEATSPTNSGTALVLPLLFGGENIGALELRDPGNGPFSDQEAARLGPFADAAAIGIRNASLFQQAQLSAMLGERNRLARELHDTIAQGLTALIMQLEAAQRGFDRDSERARSRVERAAELGRATLADVRRSVWNLAAPLEDATLAQELERLCHEFGERTGIATQFQHHGPAAALDGAAANHLRRIVLEALHNIEKHARASRVALELRTEAQVLRLLVEDNGVGFALGERQPSAQGGFGLTSLRERGRLAGGEVLVYSTPGQGTRVEITLPVNEG